MDNECFTKEKFEKLVKAVEESGYQANRTCLLTEREMKALPCSHCICKSCLIAEINGGAPGCGDCYECLKGNYSWFCNNCPDYYNIDNPKGDCEEYWKNKMSGK